MLLPEAERVLEVAFRNVQADERVREEERRKAIRRDGPVLDGISNELALRLKPVEDRLSAQANALPARRGRATY